MRIEKTDKEWTTCPLCSGPVFKEEIGYYCLDCDEYYIEESMPSISLAPSGPNIVGPPGDGETAPEDRSKNIGPPCPDGEDEADKVCSACGHAGRVQHAYYWGHTFME